MKSALENNPVISSILEIEKEEFAQNIRQGLSKKNKTLPSKYFYDGKGSKLFQEIMGLPEYYLTRAETEIFTKQYTSIIQQIASDTPFTLVDLGAGDAAKTKILLKPLVEEHFNFTYAPVDISGDAMEELILELKVNLPTITVKPQVGDYFNALEQLQHQTQNKKVVLFLGSNIGNFPYSEILNFLRKLRNYLNSGDQVLIGFDLKKDPRLIRRAYDDANGTTAAFNFNLLNRINQTFSGNFNLSNFNHFAEYDPISGEMKSYLVSTCSQEVYLKDINFQVYLAPWEAIQTESSFKFSEKQIEEIASETGYSLEMVFTDEKHYFADVLFNI